MKKRKKYWVSALFLLCSLAINSQANATDSRGHHSKSHSQLVSLRKRHAAQHARVAAIYRHKKHYYYTERNNRTLLVSNENLSVDKNENINAADLCTKYANILGVASSEITDNIELFREINNWYGTPYQYGGDSKDGIDCSAFTRTIECDVYGEQLPRCSNEQYDSCQHINKEDLREGDLVFFSSGGKCITHVGVYLQNNKFVHASSSCGVMISDLSEPYWQRIFRGGGRIDEKLSY